MYKSTHLKCDAIAIEKVQKDSQKDCLAWNYRLMHNVYCWN